MVCFLCDLCALSRLVGSFCTRVPKSEIRNKFKASEGFGWKSLRCGSGMEVVQSRRCPVRFWYRTTASESHLTALADIQTTIGRIRIGQRAWSGRRLRRFARPSDRLICQHFRRQIGSGA
jgi:hypothetical protein